MIVRPVRTVCGGGVVGNDDCESVKVTCDSVKVDNRDVLSLIKGHKRAGSQKEAQLWRIKRLPHAR